MCVAFGWLSERSGEKNFMPENFLEINRYFALTSYCIMIGQSSNAFSIHIRVFFGRKTKSPCSDLFIHWLIKQMMNTYRNHFSRSYKNRSNSTLFIILFPLFWKQTNWFLRLGELLHDPLINLIF